MIPISFDSVLRRSESLGAYQVQGAWVVATSSGHMHFFESNAGPSPVAQRIFELVDGVRTVKNIAEQLCHEFDVDYSVCAKDTLAFLETLLAKEIVVL